MRQAGVILLASVAFWFGSLTSGAAQPTTENLIAGALQACHDGRIATDRAIRAALYEKGQSLGEQAVAADLDEVVQTIAAGRPPTHPTMRNGRPATGFAGFTFKSPDGTPDLDKGVGLTPLSDRHIADGAIDIVAASGATVYEVRVQVRKPHAAVAAPIDWAGVEVVRTPSH